MKKKAADILDHIRHYCKDVQETLERIGKDKTIFETDKDFREATKGTVYWPAIKGMRNLFAHNYGAIDIDLVWETAVNDIPMLLTFCEQSIAMYRLMEQDEVEPEEEWEH